VIARWRAEPAGDEAYELGEGPLWDPARERLLWVDVTAGTVHEGRLAGRRVLRTRSTKVDAFAGAVVCARTGALLVAGMDALLEVGADGEVTPGPAILPAAGGRRLNDGGCDPVGAFVVGSLELGGRAGGEVLVRVGRDRRITVLDDDLTLSNGLAWTAGGLLYSIDSGPRVIWVRDYDAATGTSGPRRELVRFADTTPDGMCLGADGSLWVACWGAGEVRRLAPTGELTGVVSVPTAHVSSVAFVGPGLDRLLITTARQGETDPGAGRLYLADVGTTGLPVPCWAGFDDGFDNEEN